MKHELIGGYPTADGREQMGRFLRHAFPLDLGSFARTLNGAADEKEVKAPSRH
jgi:hypothetical protein